MKPLIFILCFLSTVSLAASDEAEKMRAEIKGHLNEVNACYTTALKQMPDIEGKIVVDWAVSDTGKVTKATINEAKTTLKDANVHICITDKFKSWKFPAAPKGQVITVSYPFVFTK